MNLWHYVQGKHFADENLLTYIFISTSMSLQKEAVDVDIDEILDMDTDDIRRSHLFVSTQRCFESSRRP